MYKTLKENVLNANKSLKDYHLVIFTWGNVSTINPERNAICIKPSGVSYDKMSAEDMVVLDLEGNVLEGDLKPSVDLPTHLELYRKFPEIGSIVHTHSPYATAWAQNGRSIPVYGTTHADYFCGEVPCARILESAELDEYEKNTGKVLIEAIVDPLKVPACIAAGHGAFAWGRNPEEAVFNAVVLEEIAKMALLTEVIPGNTNPLPDYILDKHFQRKHGKNATYGQNGPKK